MSKVLQVSYHQCNKAIKIASKSVRSFSVRENWVLYELVMAKNKRDRLHNKGCYHKGQYNVKFFCTKGLGIQINKRMATSSSLCKGPIFYFSVFTFMQRAKVILSIPFLFFSFGKHHLVRKDLGAYVQLNMSSMSYYWLTSPTGEYVGRWNYKPLSFYVSGWNVLFMCTRWVSAIIEDYMVEYVELLRKLCWISWITIAWWLRI